MNHNYYCLHTSVQRLLRLKFICMKRLAINANGNTITSFVRELNPMGVGEYIYINIYINIYVCVCVCVCVCMCVCVRVSIYLCIYIWK